MFLEYPPDTLENSHCIYFHPTDLPLENFPLKTSTQKILPWNIRIHFINSKLLQDALSSLNPSSINEWSVHGHPPWSTIFDIPRMAGSFFLEILAMLINFSEKHFFNCKSKIWSICENFHMEKMGPFHFLNLLTWYKVINTVEITHKIWSS